MDQVQDGAVMEFLEILRRDGDETDDEDASNRVRSLPKTNAEFETCRLRWNLCSQLEAQLGAAVDEALASHDLEIDSVDGVRPDAVNQVVARLTASPPFVDVVGSARAAIKRAVRVQTAASAAVVNPADNSAAATDAACGFLRRNVDALLSSDTERESMHVKKKAARRDDWVGVFDLSGGFGGGGGFSPRVDIEAALGQLEAGLENSDGAASSVVEALDLLAEADPELFQFGNYWPLFLKLARRALDSSDPAVHAKAMSLHWVMYEKSMGMCAADMCEGVLAHARGYFSTTVHVLSAPSTHQPMSAGERGAGAETTGVAGTPDVVVVGDSELACAAREARAIHGMLVTIHETFQHLPERQVWSIVGSFFFLLGDAVASVEYVPGGRTDSETSGGDGFVGPYHPEGNSGGGSAVPRPDQPPVYSWGNDSTSAVLLPAHFLAVAGRVDEWLPGWLRALPTGRLVRAVSDAGLVEAMARRCKSRGRVYLRSRPPCHGPPSSDPAVAIAVSAPSEACRPKAAVVRHRLSGSAGSSGTFCSAGSTAPLSRALWLSAAELQGSLLLQSVSFLGVLATHCRGTLRPCPRAPPGAESDSGDERTGGGGGGEGGATEGEADEAGADRGLEKGEEVLQALVECAWRGEGGRESGTGTPRSWRRETPAAKVARSTSVRCTALHYVGRLAKATSGGESTPFTPLAIDRLFSPLGGAESNGGGHHGSAGGTPGDGRGKELDGSLQGDSPAFLGALAEIAGVLLSSRGASVGFYVDGPEGLRASHALLVLVRCTAELARRACWHHRSALPDGIDGTSLGGEGHPPPEGRFQSLERGDSKRLAVDFACALARVMRSPAKQRAAGRRALWRCGVPHALAVLLACLEQQPRPDVTASRVEQASYTKHGSSVGGGREYGEEEDGLHGRLLLSLVEWARDLPGVSCLRRAGLAAPCGSFLAGELGARHLSRSAGDECADARPLAAAMRLALCAEGLDALLSADGGVADGVEAGLARLGELLVLPELLQSRKVGMPPPHALAARSVGGNHGAAGGTLLDEQEIPGRLAGLELDSDARDLRCLNFICRFSLSGSFFSAPDPDGLGTGQLERWLRWGLSRVAPSGKLCPRSGQDEAKEEGDGCVPQDVHVAALQLAADLVADLSTAVAAEATWSLAESLVRQEADDVTVGTCTGDDAVVGGEAAGKKAAPKARVGFGTPCSGLEGSGGGGGEHCIGTIYMPDVVEPAALGRARLAVSLTCLGGPNEERHKLLRKLRELEASAGGTIAGSALGTIASAVSVPTAATDVRGMPEGVRLPDDSASDEDWWGAAGRCAPEVVASLAGPRGAPRKEAFALLRKAAARRSLLLPEESPPRSLSEPAAMNCASPRGSGERYWPVSLQGRGFDAGQAFMTKLCFSYARGLGLVDDSHREQFAAGLGATLASASSAGPTAGSTSRPPAVSAPAMPPPPPLQADCDWFAVVAFMASGADSAAASELLQSLHRHAPRAAFVLPLAGRRFAAKAARETAGCVEAPGGGAASVLVAEAADSSPGAAEGQADKMEGVSGGALARRPSARFDDSPAAAEPSRGDPPLLLLVSLVEEVLEEEMPLMSAALRSSGWAAAPLAARWMRQCMLCVVDWPGVVAYLALALLRGHDYQVYFVVALFRAAEPAVMEAASRGLDLMALLGRGEALEDFDLEKSFSIMEGLERRHRERCLAATRAYLAR